MHNRMMADTSSHTPQENYRYSNHRGLPFVGDPGLMRDKEYLDKTVTVARGCYGNFDTAQPASEHFGRTLHEILSRTMTGEFKVLLHREQWIRCERFGVRILYFVQWLEYSDRLTADVMATANLRSLNSVPNSR